MRLALTILATLALAVAVATTASPAAATPGSLFRPPVSGKLGVVATESPAAARVGRGVLEGGGNAVDAAVATVFAMNVANPGVLRDRRRRVHGLPQPQGPDRRARLP